MDLSKSYFAIPDLFQFFDRYLNAYRHRQIVTLGEKNVEVNWTDRAGEELKHRQKPLTIEIQLYFSCVVKKRVLFHDQADFEPAVTINDKLKLCYRAIQSDSCDPETFARDYPGSRKLESKAARNMQPSRVNIDFSKGKWSGDFDFGA